MKRAVILLGIVLTSLGAFAQKKVKYKDLYVLLRAKNYEVASGFLHSFLAEETDHPNANYQMGLMLENKLSELDLLKETEAITSRADSAILYFDKAKGLITEKDVKKHDDDYYELFKRRNLRTGKFEVILSDVQLDIEQRVEALNKLKNEVSDVKIRFSKAIDFYAKAQSQYGSIKSKYGDELTLAIGATDSTLSDLQQLGSNYDSALFNLKAYKSARKEFEGDKFEDIIINKKALEGFSDEGLTEPDFYSRKIDMYDFYTWSANQQTIIKSKREFVNNLIKFDESLEKMAEDIERDSVDLSGEIFGMVTSPVLKELKMVDYDSWLMPMYQYKIGLLNLNSVWMGWHLNMADTVNVGAQLDYAKKIRSQVEGVVKLEKGLEGLDAEAFIRRYHVFVENRFGTIDNLNAFVTRQEEIVASEVAEINRLDSILSERDKWAIWGEDSIRLFMDIGDTGRYITTYLDTLTSSRDIVVSGILNEQEPQFFFGLAPSSRVMDTVYVTPLEIPTPLQLDSLYTQSGKPSEDTYAFLLMDSPASEEATLIYASTEKGIEWKVKVEGLVATPLVEYSNEFISITQEGGAPIVYSLDGEKQEQAPESEQEGEEGGG